MFVCRECSYASRVKLGKCPSCSEYGTMYEEKNVTNSSKKKTQGRVLSKNMGSASEHKVRNIDNKEMQRVFQGGVTSSGMYLLGGAPGIGKSTFVLQLLVEMLRVKNENISIGYFSGEEQAKDVHLRLERIAQGVATDSIDIYHASCLEDIVATAQNQGYAMIIVDSIQTIFSQEGDSVAGSIQQVKLCADRLLQFGKSENICMLIIGHITKGGEIAGPKYLEHIVDVVLYMEGDTSGDMRFLRAKKNRFGYTDEVGVFEMHQNGLQPVYDLADRLIKESGSTMDEGTVYTLGLDNGRPVLARVEVLLHKTFGKFPQRTCLGVDNKRVDMICAILSKYCKCKLDYYDIYVHIPGEFRFFDSGLDLAIAVGLYGHYQGRNYPTDTIFIGELGLTGKVQQTKLHRKREKEVPQNMNLIDYKVCSHISKLPDLL